MNRLLDGFDGIEKSSQDDDQSADEESWGEAIVAQ
jgi:hypothetical protein